MPYQLGATSWYSLRKSPNLSHQIEGDDPFIRLNDDIIVSHILRRLSLEDAVRSSVLCHRWKNLWRESIGPRLIFSYSSDRLYNPSFVVDQDVLRLKPLLEHGISHILETYLQPKLEELTICFDFDSSSSFLIDRWIEYAFKKGITQLVLDFSRWRNHVPKDNYTFPGVDKLLAWCAMCDNNLYQPVNHGSMSNLRDICLKCVNVSVEIIECLLSNCPLERLGVWESKLLQEIRICKQDISLKSLEFVRCRYRKITISLPHLVSLRYTGHTHGLCLLHVPLLSELSIGSGFCLSFLTISSLSFGYISQMKRLTLDIDHKFIIRSVGYALEFPLLVKLEQLEVRLQTQIPLCLLWPLILIKAAPILHIFSVKLHTLIDQVPPKRQPGELERNLQNAIKQIHHQRLKLIEMSGFAGHANEVQLGKYLLGISESLEQFVVRPWLPGNREKPHPLDDISSAIKKHRELAQQFKTWLPQTAKLVVL